jgi:helix-turn-helix protein
VDGFAVKSTNGSLTALQSVTAARVQRKGQAMKTKTATPEGSSRKHSGADSTSLAAQRQCVINALRESVNGLTTIELREKFDVMMPASRVHELRWQYGFNIEKIPTHDTNAQGNRHSVARYVLLSGKWKGAA